MAFETTSLDDQHAFAIALFRALAEAIQSRLTLIAGVRDDIMPPADHAAIGRDADRGLQREDLQRDAARGQPLPPPLEPCERHALLGDRARQAQSGGLPPPLPFAEKSDDSDAVAWK